jgi:hypothetical protein
MPGEAQSLDPERRCTLLFALVRQKASPTDPLAGTTLYRCPMVRGSGNDASAIYQVRHDLPDDILAVIFADKIDLTALLIIFHAATILLNHTVRDFSDHFQIFILFSDGERFHDGRPPFCIDPDFSVFFRRALQFPQLAHDRLVSTGSTLCAAVIIIFIFN